jgi:hydroxymethylpyrimidine kinase/phosphomethylpyrimidine kinase
MAKQKKRILAIGGFDPSGKAGILQDTRAVLDLGESILSVPTALTVQDYDKCTGYFAVEPSVFENMLDTVIRNCKPHSVKIGMVPTLALAEIIVKHLAGKKIPVVVDPVFASTDGCVLSDGNDYLKIFKTLSPIITVVTPNLPEYEMLKDIITCPNIVIKGGHSSDNIVFDKLITPTKTHDLGKLRRKTNIRGKGCYFASVFAVFLAHKMDFNECFKNTEFQMESFFENYKTGL